jgi:DNA-binding HxlR family transcriptional regulator
MSTHAHASPLAAAVERVGDRWSLLIVEALLAGPRRFNELQEQVTGIAPNILSGRLKQLEQDGIVVATPYSRRPLRVTYELTAGGRELAGALRLLAHWGAAGAEDRRGLQHGACGGEVEARWYCPTCARVVDDDELGDVRFI